MRSVADFDRAEVIDALTEQRRRTIALFEQIAIPAWETEVTPGWRVREVAAHLITTDEAALTGKILRLGMKQVPIDVVERWNDEQVARVADRPIPSLLHALDLWGRRMARALRITPGAIVRRSLPTPFGSVSALWLAMLRVYDEWVHGEDVRRALGRASDDDPDSARPVARLLMAAIPLQTLPRLGRDASGSATLRLLGVQLPPFFVDMTARRYGLGEAGSVVEVRAAQLVMVAARRDGWRDLETAGDLRIEGERAPAEALLDALLVV